MTDQELKDLVAGLAIAQEKTEKMLSEESAKTEKKAQELFDAQKKTSEAQDRTDEQMKKTDEQMRRTDEKLERMGIRLGNMQNNQGELVEEFFYTSFDKKMELGGVKYDDIGRNWTKKKGDIHEEFDIILTNGKAIALIEVKQKAHPSDIEKLERKVLNFKYLFPVYSDYKIYGGLASLKLVEDVETKLLEKGFYAITQEGNHREVKNPRAVYGQPV